MTVEEIAVAALARASEFSNKVPSTRSVIYRRIGVRQQELFSHAARLNPEFYGICAVGTLINGSLNLADMVSPVQAADTITRIDIEGIGTSPYVLGQEVRVVSLSDRDVEDSPRATLRNRVIRQVGTDLALAVSLKVHYSRIPLPVVPETDAARVIDLEEPHTELLVVDAARQLVAKTLALDPNARTAVDAVLAAEEGVLLRNYEQHVREYAGSMSTRFSDPQFAPAQPPAAKT